jgi:cell wall-associated NlpC family hydrolase
MADVTGMEVVRVARGFLGTPFRHQGRMPGRGLDCAGVIVCAARALGLSGYDVAGYGRLPSDDAMADHLRAAGCRDIANGSPGDIYLMRFETDPQHLACITDIGVLHAYAEIGRVVEHRLDAVWRGRIVRAFRLPGIV